MGKVLAATMLALAVLNSTMAAAQQPAAPGSEARTSTELHAHNYGDHDRACIAWTDWCRQCRRDSDDGAPSCNNLGFACVPAEVECVLRRGDHEGVQRWLHRTLRAGTSQ